MFIRFGQQHLHILSAECIELTGVAHLLADLDRNELQYSNIQKSWNRL